MQFQKKDIKPTKRVCLRLREAREQAGFDIATVAKKLRMSTKHVEALEDCRFTDLPFSAVYQKKMITSYLNAIGMEPKPFVQQFVYEEVKTTPKETPEVHSKQNYLRMPNMPFLIRSVAIGAVVLAVGLYLFLQVKHLVEPPELVLFTPDQDVSTREDVLTVTGKTDPEASVRINGQQIMNNDQGFFEEDISLAEGVNTIFFTAKKKHGKETTMTRHVVYKKDHALSAAPSVQVIQ